MDSIIIKGAQFSCHLGVTAEERKEAQDIILDIEMLCDTKKAAKTGLLSDTVGYSQVHANVKKLIEGKEFILIESMVELVASEILRNFQVHEVTITLKKPGALHDKGVEYAAISIVRKR